MCSHLLLLFSRKLNVYEIKLRFKAISEIIDHRNNRMLRLTKTRVVQICCLQNFSITAIVFQNKEVFSIAVSKCATVSIQKQYNTTNSPTILYENNWMYYAILSTTADANLN